MNNDYTVGKLIYDAGIYDGMNINIGDLEFYKKWILKNKKSKVLELCCGTGRLTIPLAKEGANITGLDFTKTMLDQARKKANLEGVNIDFIQADIRDFHLEETYDLIFIPFNSIHHMYSNEDLFNAFSNVQKHLNPGGKFIFDCFNPDINFIVSSQNERKTISTYSTDDGRSVVIEEEMTYDNESQINRIKWHYFINGEFDSTQNLDMRMFYPQELNQYVKMSGFKVLEKFGDFDESGFGNKSPKQIFICQS